MRLETRLNLVLLLVSCASSVLSCSKLQVSKGSISTGNADSAVPPEKDDSETVSPPANISGSYLMCEQTRDTDPTAFQATARCVLQDETTREKVDLAVRFRSYLWKTDIPALAAVTSSSRELVGDATWHFEVVIRADSRISLDKAVEGTLVTLTVLDQESVSKQTSASVKPAPIDCSGLAGGTWVPVPGDSIYGTKDFCVQKYGASNIGGVPIARAGVVPWASISQTLAISACASLGTDFHLISNPEWMTLAANLAHVSSNWSSGAVGSGSLRRGHGDSLPNSACEANAVDANAYVEGSCAGTNSGTFEQRRTSILSNGVVVWDIGGNLWSWINYNNPADKPTPAVGSWAEFTAMSGSTTTPKAHIIPLNSVQSWWSDSWISAQGIGQIFTGQNGNGGALLRGGRWPDNTRTGAFTFYLNSSPSSSGPDAGFRCAYAPVK